MRKTQELLIELSGINDNIISHRINVIIDFHNEWVVRRNEIIKELKLLGIEW
ncbi:hypothetical protein [Clostridium saccharobutylicum]|uniref:hypothetical protein n=1 Tax=Clostridium saccharobutylicum TaxID=169679 RepID=UPI0003FD9D6E|nr:hypothetical protein [Clostridium saccharobutylicum]AQR91229.1 hypothetical protein CLOSC_29530 [Clostridium saccharobutylicum]AQS01133.1 hypothetical protein CSACC_29600 [Clostridium saccharobutylicum]AQS15116.1 hypothetical protein CLOSACC_29600 [Clostridium saccharobutylicum]MBA2905242.1 transcriptional regulator of NAD metabolism [Clostridium saccharobutylicum]MBA8789815.1 transcriptional regulator of NAD metabolism [Clostridium saccharobutylicum]